MTEAQKLKKELVKAFPNVKFSCTMREWYGVYVHYNFGPKADDVKSIADSLGIDLPYYHIGRHCEENFEESAIKALAELFGSDPVSERIMIVRIFRKLFEKTSFEGCNPKLKGVEYGIETGAMDDICLINWEETIKGKVYVSDHSEAIKAMKLEEKIFKGRVEKRKRLEPLKKIAHNNYMEDQKRVQELSKSSVVINAESEDLFIKGKFAGMNKNNTLREYYDEVYQKHYYSIWKVKVVEFVKCSKDFYSQLKNNLMTSFEFFKGKGGTNSTYDLGKDMDLVEFHQLPQEEQDAWKAESYTECLFVYCKEYENGFLVDPEGYAYARYAGLLSSDEQKELIKKANELIG